MTTPSVHPVQTYRNAHRVTRDTFADADGTRTRSAKTQSKNLRAARALKQRSR